MPDRPLRKPLVTPIASVTGARHWPWKRQPLASSATAASTIAEIAQRIGSGDTWVSTRLPSGAPTTAATMQQRRCGASRRTLTARGSSGRATAISSSRQSEMPIAGPYSAEKTGVIIIAAPKPAKPRTMPATSGHGGGDQEGKSQQVRHRGGRR